MIASTTIHADTGEASELGFQLAPGPAPLPLAFAPWKIATGKDGKRTKILAMSGPISGYKHGSNWGELAWPKNWQWGVICAPHTGLFVVDADHAEGWEALLAAEGIEPPETMRVSTHDNRYHDWYDARHLPPELWPRQGEILDQETCHVADVKVNGFVPMPGSVHPSGEIYMVIRKIQPQPMPEWYARWLLKKRQESNAIAPAGRRSTSNGDGWGRNVYLTRVKGACIGQGMTEAEANKRVIEVNASLDDPLPVDDELFQTVLRPKNWQVRRFPDANKRSSPKTSENPVTRQKTAYEKVLEENPPLTEAELHSLRLADPGKSTRVLADPEAMARRLADEMSARADTDWVGRVEERDAYRMIAQCAIARKPLRWQPPEEHLWYLVREGLVTGDLRMLPDPEQEQHDQYPNVRPGRNPKAGRQLKHRARRDKIKVEGWPTDRARWLVARALQKIADGTAKVLNILPERLRKRWWRRRKGGIPLPVWCIAWEAEEIQQDTLSYDCYRLISVGKTREMLAELCGEGKIHIWELPRIRRDQHKWRSDSIIWRMGPADEVTRKRIERQQRYRNRARDWRHETIKGELIAAGLLEPEEAA